MPSLSTLQVVPELLKREDIRNRLFFSILVTILAIQVWAALVNIHFGIDSIQMMSVFESDETAAVARTQKNLAEGDLSPDGMFQYGFFFNTLAYWTVRFFQFLGYNRDTTVAFLAINYRLIAVLSFLLLLFLFQRLSLLLVKSRELSWLSVLLLASVQQIYYWSQTIHPDITQTMLIVAAAWVALKSHMFRNANWAAFLAGMAFGTKYGGIFILPFLFIPALMNDRPDLSLKGKLRGKAPLFLLSFLLGWLIFNPYVIFNFIHFLRWLKLIIVYTLTGFVGSTGQITSANPLLWFPVLYRAFYTPGALVMLAGLFPALWFLVQSIKRREGLREPDTLNRIVIGAYCLFALVHILLGVKSREVRYAFHFIPFLILLSFTGWAILSCRMKQRGRAILSFALLLLIAPANLNAVHSMASCSNKESDARLASGRVLEERYSPDTRILADFYAYVPPKFKNTLVEWGIRSESILRENPQVILVSRAMTGRWIWKAPGTSFRDGSFVTNPSYPEAQLRSVRDVFSMLFSNPSRTYRAIYEDDHVLILEQQNLPEGKGQP
ncbi:MAG: hypothetical protein HPY65_01035 [Syntrophaceae bacterium]|nr:hypothetical protein [Syntrophaceae bacterium]